MAAVLQCPYDPEAELISDYRSGDVVCSKCGLVVAGRVIAVDQEFPLFFDAGTATDPTWIGATKQAFAAATECFPTGSEIRDKAFELRRKTIDKEDRRLKSAIISIYEISERICLPKSVRQQAVSSFKELHECKKLQKAAPDATAAACVYIACRLQNVPRSFLEICAASAVAKKAIARSFKNIAKTLGTDFARVNSSDYLSRFCGHLGLNFRVLACANHIAAKTSKLQLLPGRLPISVAAASISRLAVSLERLVLLPTSPPLQA